MAGRGRVYVSGYFRGAPRQVPRILTVNKREFDEFEERFWMCHSLDGKPEVDTGQSRPSKSLAKLRRQRVFIKPTGSSRGHLNFDGTPRTPTEQVNFEGTSNDLPAPENSGNCDGIPLKHTPYRHSTKEGSNPTGCQTDGTTSKTQSKEFPKGTLQPSTPNAASRQVSTDQAFVSSLNSDGPIKFDGTPLTPREQVNFNTASTGTRERNPAIASKQDTVLGDFETDTTQPECSKNQNLTSDSLFTKQAVGTISVETKEVAIQQCIDGGAKKSICPQESITSKQSRCSKGQTSIAKGQIEGTISTDVKEEGYVIPLQSHKVTREQRTGYNEKKEIDLDRGTTSKNIGCEGTLPENSKEGNCIVILKQSVDADRQKIIDLDKRTTSKQARVKGNLSEDSKEEDCKIILNFAGKKSICSKATSQQEGSSKHTNPINKGLLTNDPVDGTISMNAKEKTSKATTNQSTDFTGTSKELVISEDTKLIDSPSTPVDQEFLEIKDRVEEGGLVKAPLKRKQALRSKFFEKPKRTRRKDQNCNDIRTDLLSLANEALKNIMSLQKKVRVKLKVASSPVPGRVRASARLKTQAKANKRTINYNESKLDGLIESFIEDCTSKTIPVDSKLCATDSGYNSSFSSCTETVVIESRSENIPGLEHGQEENQSAYMIREILKQSLDCKEEVPQESQSPNNEEVKIEEGSEDDIGDRRSHKAPLGKIASHCEECPNDEIVKFEEVLDCEDKVGDKRSREALLVKMGEGCREDCGPWQENEKLKQKIPFNEITVENNGNAIKVKKEILVPATEELPQQETLNCEKISIHAGEVKTLPDFEATMICEHVTKHEETQDGKASDPPLLGAFLNFEEKITLKAGKTLKVETLPDFKATKYPATPKHEETQDAESKWCPPGSRVPLWTPPKSPHNLIEETLYHNPWGLLVATIFLNKTSSYQAGPYIFDFLKKYPEPSKVLQVKPSDLEPFFTKIGLKKRALQVWRMSHDFLHKKWRNVGELYGIGKYGEDAYRMFCLGDMEGVEPKDRFLKIYKAWYHMIERRKKVEF